MPKKSTLNTTLRREPFTAIHNGQKTEEYRDITKFWKSRLLQKNPDGSYNSKKFREYDTVRFRNGYNPDSPVMEVEFKGTTIRHYQFVIKLGKVLSVKNYTPEQG